MKTFILFCLFAFTQFALAEDESQEVWSQPEEGQVREEPQPEEPQPQPKIWSQPEQGQERQTLPPPPPGYYEHYYERRRIRVVEPDSGEALTEFGFTTGTPAILNLNFGFWGPRSTPILLRFSGMYLGDTRGAQLDIGYVFFRESNFRQYFAISVLSMQSTSNFYYWDSNTSTYYKEMFTGIGPCYGLNLYGLSLQVGVAVGPYENFEADSGGVYYNWDGTTTTVPASTSAVRATQPQLLLQLGYTFMW